MTAATLLPVTRREAILAHLARHPDLTAPELARVIGSGRYLGHLLADMTFKGQVVSRTGYRPGQGREVRLWSVAPPGAIPPRPPDMSAALARKRERDRTSVASRRARARAAAPLPGVPALTGAACAGADPGLFFPAPGDAETEAAAVAICAVCPDRLACLAGALARREPAGIWGGVNFETGPQSAVTTSRKVPDYA